MFENICLRFRLELLSSRPSVIIINCHCRLRFNIIGYTRCSIISSRLIGYIRRTAASPSSLGTIIVADTTCADRDYQPPTSEVVAILYDRRRDLELTITDFIETGYTVHHVVAAWCLCCHERAVGTDTFVNFLIIRPNFLIALGPWALDS